MRATVFTDPSLAKHAGRFVWLSIDTENEKNAAFLEAYPWEAVPTFRVIDPKSGEVVYQWLGAVDVATLAKRFDEASIFRAAHAYEQDTPWHTMRPPVGNPERQKGR